jgi:GTPase
MFTDRVTIRVKAGKGGDGRLNFRHEKYREKGGPDGGDGGRGGDIIFAVSHNLNTLSAFRRRQSIEAEAGQPGGTNRRHGRAGKETIIPVPAGTQIYSDGELLADLIDDDQTALIAKGGRGGFGNAHFTSSTRQTPRAVELGERGDELDLQLELKLVADVGLVGLPNAGKSTLLSVVSNAKPEIGDYPFTTLTPNLGVVDIHQESILMADIPGLIEGASQGKGLGDEFLRHIERTAVLLHLIDATSETLASDFVTIVSELKSYEVDLTSKPRLIVPTKIEAVPPHLRDNKLAEIRKAAGLDIDAPLYAISAVAHEGVTELLRAVLPIVKTARAERAAMQAEEAIPVINEASQPDLWRLEPDKKGFVLHGQKLEGFARRTDWENDASVDRMRDILRKQGVWKELARQKAEPGTVVKIGDHELEWLG